MRFFHRCAAFLGMLAMLGAMLTAPAAAFADVVKAAPGTAVTSQGDMPCHDPCPDCPKSCPDVMACVLKCFHTSAPLPLGEPAAAAEPQLVHGIANSAPRTGVLTPPLLRPPIV